MRELVDKTVIFIVCLAFYASGADSIYMVVPILTAMVISALLSYLDNKKIILVIYAFYLFLCLFRFEFIIFLPLISYDAAYLKNKGYYWILSYFPLVVHYDTLPLITMLSTASFILAVVLLKHRTSMIQIIEGDQHKLRDSTMEISLKLKNQNKELMEKQDYEVHLATITERNRIARDIHDNVGHLLSRSILQIGALLAVNRDEGMTAQLRLVKDTLSEAMDSVRISVHDLHEDSVDLENEIQKLIAGFTFCPIHFHYDMDENPEKKIKYCFLAVVKEALSNIMKHSNATEASITIAEHPAMVQLIMKDNGKKAVYNRDNGIGIKNITDRVSALKGNIHISTEDGFRIFISIPKSNE